MKYVYKLLQESLRITFFFFSATCIGLSILYPFMAGMKDCPLWLPFIIYPVAILQLAHHNLKNKQ